MSATRQGINLWEGPIIPFEIDPNFDNPNRVRTVIRDHYEAHTNLRFVRRSRQKSFVLFRNGQACSSPVGFQGEPNQPITCIAGGAVATIIHEIGHALGLIHEHQRADRDQVVLVQDANIEPGKQHNFEKLQDSRNLTDYDTLSVMHYGERTFSANNLPTLVAVNAGTQLDNSMSFTSQDLQGLRELYPQVGVVRRGDSGFDAAGRVEEMSVVNGSTASQVFTVVKTAEGILRLIMWRVTSQGGIQRLADSGNQVGVASSVAIDRARQIVTACRTEEGDLKLISWTASGNTLQRDKDSGNQAGRASEICLLALTDTLLVTACRASNNALTLITWQLESDGAFKRLADSDTQAGTVAEISLIRIRTVGTNHHVATTVRSAEGRVRTIVWRIAANGAVARLGDSGTQLGEGTLIESAIHAGTGVLVVSCRTAEGRLRLITLSISSNGSSVIRRDDSGDQAGTISRNALSSRPTGVLSAVRAEGGNLRLISWRIDGDGRITRLGDSTLGQAGEVGSIRLAGDTGVPHAPVITCVQTEERDLRLISWDDAPEHGELG